MKSLITSMFNSLDILITETLYKFPRQTNTHISSWTCKILFHPAVDIYSVEGGGGCTSVSETLRG